MFAFLRMGGGRLKFWESAYLVANTYGVNFIKIGGSLSEFSGGQKFPIRGLTVIERSLNAGNKLYLVANTYGTNLKNWRYLNFQWGQKPPIRGGYM